MNVPLPKSIAEPLTLPWRELIWINEKLKENRVTTVSVSRSLNRFFNKHIPKMLSEEALSDCLADVAEVAGGTDVKSYWVPLIKNGAQYGTEYCVEYKVRGQRSKWVGLHG